MESRRVSRTEDGFTLIEVLIAAALLGALAMAGLFVGMEAYQGSFARSERDTIVSVLERARSRAMANLDEAPWGACFDSAAKRYVIFRGAAYAAGSDYASVPANPSAVASSTPAAFDCADGGIAFFELSGTTSGAMIGIAENGRSETITVNDEGAIMH